MDVGKGRGSPYVDWNGGEIEMPSEDFGLEASLSAFCIVSAKVSVKVPAGLLIWFECASNQNVAYVPVAFERN